jgi:hypothetical protein
MAIKHPTSVEGLLADCAEGSGAKDEVGGEKHAVATAKEAWWKKHVANINAIRSSATA